MFAIVFLPLNLVMTLIAIWKKKYLLWIVSGILTVAILLTSPTLWGLVALKGVYDKWVQEQTRIDKIAQRVIETKKQEDASKNEKPAVISPESKTPSVTVDSGKCESTEGRTYIQSQKFFWDIYQVGWSRFDELTTEDLDATLFSPWIEGTFATRVENSFGQEIKKNRKEISSLTSGIVQNIEAVNWKYEYSNIGASLFLKYAYIGVIGSLRKNFSNGQNEEIEAKLNTSRDILRKAIKDFSTGHIPMTPITVLSLAKDGGITEKTLEVKKFPNGNFGILVATPSASSTDKTVENTKTTEIY